MSNANRDTTDDELLELESLQDPISYELLTDPVVASDGFTYNRATFQELQNMAAQSRTPLVSPLTRRPLSPHVTANRVVIKLIDELRARQQNTGTGRNLNRCTEEAKEAKSNVNDSPVPARRGVPQASPEPGPIAQFLMPLHESDDPLAWWLRKSPMTLLLIVVLLHTPGIIADEDVRCDIATFFAASLTCLSLAMLISNIIFLLASLPLFTLYALAAEPVLLLPVWVIFFTLKLRFEFYCWIFAVNLKSAPFKLGTSNYMFALVILCISLSCLHLYKTHWASMLWQWYNRGCRG